MSERDQVQAVSPQPLDASQQAVAEAALHESLAVIGAPGSGRTTALIETVALALSAGVSADEVLVIGANRLTAAELRDRLDERLRIAAAGSTLGRTLASVAISIIGDHRARNGLTAPKLLTGSVQDSVIAELLDPDEKSSVSAPAWPSWLAPEALSLPGLRSEIRALLAAMVELGVSPDRLRTLAVAEPSSDGATASASQQRYRSAWLGAADFAETYFDVLANMLDNAFDVPSALTEAARLLSERPVTASDPLAFGNVRLVLVDDAQELTASGARLLRAFECRGARVVTFGDPDIATGAFHGGLAEGALSWRANGDPQPRRLLLGEVHRSGPELRRLVSDVTRQIGSRGEVQHRGAEAASDLDLSASADAIPAAVRMQSESEMVEAEQLAGVLQRIHLQEQVPWSEMAVISRTGSRLEEISRVLDRFGVPNAAAGARSASGDSTVAAILTMGEAAVRGAISADELTSALTSPLGGFDLLELRRVRQAARAREVAAGGTRSPIEVLVQGAEAAMAGASDPVLEAAIEDLAASRRPAPARELRAFFAALHRMRQRYQSDDPIDAVLFEAWRDAARAKRWQDEALSSSPGAAAMNRRLDAVVVLFDRAKRFVEREPDAPLEVFLRDWRRDNVVDDSLAQRGRTDVVTLLTPAAAVGREWQVVAVVSVQDGSWPNLRVRDSILGAGRLEEALRNDEASSILDRRAAVLADETRLFAQALSRARSRVIVSAIASEHTQPSHFFLSAAAPILGSDFSIDAQTTLAYRRLGLSSLAAWLRRELAAGRGGDDERAALATLADAGVTAADPQRWLGLGGVTTDASLAKLNDGVLEARLSPSQIERFEECQVRWFVDGHAGSPPNLHMALGTIVHAVAEHENTLTTDEQLASFLDQALRSLDFETSWQLEAQRAQLLDMARAVLAFVRSPETRLVGAETPFEVSLTEPDLEPPVRVTIRGRVDRLEVRQDRFRIVDFKTSKTAISVNSAKQQAQLQAYQLAFGGLDPVATAIADATGCPPDGAVLVYPAQRTARGGMTERRQEPLDEAAAAVVRTRLIEVALGQIGATMTPNRQIAMSRPSKFQADVRAHCTREHDSCRIQAIAEVTE